MPGPCLHRAALGRPQVATAHARTRARRRSRPAPPGGRDARGEPGRDPAAVTRSLTHRPPPAGGRLAIYSIRAGSEVTAQARRGRGGSTWRSRDGAAPGLPEGGLFWACPVPPVLGLGLCVLYSVSRSVLVPPRRPAFFGLSLCLKLSL